MKEKTQLQSEEAIPEATGRVGNLWHRHRWGKILTAGIITSILIAGISYVVQVKKYRAAEEMFHRLELTGRQIRTILEASYAEQGRFPNGPKEFSTIIQDYDPRIAEGIREGALAFDYKTAETGEGYSFRVWKSDDAKFRYICTREQGCRWSPTLPFP